MLCLCIIRRSTRVCTRSTHMYVCLFFQQPFQISPAITLYSIFHKLQWQEKVEAEAVCRDSLEREALALLSTSQPSRAF